MRPCLRASYPYGVSSRPCGERTKPCLLTANSFVDRSRPRLRRPGSREDRTSPRALQSCPDEYSSSPCRRRTNPYGFTKVSFEAQVAPVYLAGGQSGVDAGPQVKGVTVTPGALHGLCKENRQCFKPPSPVIGNPVGRGNPYTLVIASPVGRGNPVSSLLSLRGRSRRELTWQSSRGRTGAVEKVPRVALRGRWIATSGLCPSSQ